MCSWRRANAPAARAQLERRASTPALTVHVTVSNFWPVEVRLRVLLVMVLVVLLILFPYRCQAGADTMKNREDTSALRPRAPDGGPATDPEL